MRLVLSIDISIDLGLVVIPEPISLVLESLLEEDVLLAILVHILQKVNASLILTAPLLLTSIPLFLVFLLGELFDHALVLGLVRDSILVVLLELLDLSATRQPLIFLVISHSLLLCQGLIQDNLVTIKISLMSLLAKRLLCGIVADQLEVPLAVEQESLLSILLLLLLLDGPLFTKHCLLVTDQVLFLLALRFTRILLPVEDCHGVPDLFLFLTCLLHLALQLLLSVQLPQLSVNLLFEHLLLNITSLVNELLLALDGRTIVVELGIFLAERVIRGLELHVLAASHLICSLLLSLVLQGLQTFKHLLTDLLRSFEIVVKFLFIDAVLGSQQLGKTSLALLEIGGLLATHLLNTALHDVLLLHFARFSLPVGLVG